MEKKIIETLADNLYHAGRTHSPVPPLTEAYPAMTADDAYAIQLENVSRRLAAGEVISGKKIGLTSPGIQRQLGVSEPDYGHLFQSMACELEVPADELLQPKIEAEIAFILREDLPGGNVTAEDVRKATEYIVGAFEIVDSRVANWRIKLPDTVADNASSGRYVLGNRKVSLGDIDLSTIEMAMRKGNEIVGYGTGTAVMGDPCLSVAWLANCLHRYGVILKKGEVVLSGAFSAAPAAFRGDVFSAKFTHLGTVQARFI